MFAPVFKIVRALLGAMALALIGAGTHAMARAQAAEGDTDTERLAFMRGKPVKVFSVRACAACPLAQAVAQMSAARAWMPASEPFVHFFMPSNGVVFEPMIREAERQSRSSAWLGAVRLLI